MEEPAPVAKLSGFPPSNPSKKARITFMIPISTIFQAETTALESQITALQSQIAAHTARITLLNEAESVADGSLEALKAAIQKVSSLAPSAVSNLRAAVLNLFTGDSTDDNNGNQPHPAPQPGSDGGEDVAKAVEAEALTGQSTEWACPLASPLACTIEVAAPAATLDYACPVPDVPEPKPYVELVPVSGCVASVRFVSPK